MRRLIHSVGNVFWDYGILKGEALFCLYERTILVNYWDLSHYANFSVLWGYFIDLMIHQE